MEKTTVGYAARDLGISRQLVHIYIKKGLIRAEKSGPERTAPYVLHVEDIAKLIGSNKLVAAHAQRHRLLGKPKKRKAAGAATSAAEGAATDSAGTATSAATSAAEVAAGAVEGAAGAAGV